MMSSAGDRPAKKSSTTASLAMKPLLLALLLLFYTADGFSPTTLPSATTRFTAPPLVSPRIRTVTPPFPTITRTSTPCHWRVHKSPSSRLTALHATASKQRQFLHKKRLAILFAFLTGWADYLLFIKYRFFSTMMTGNSMWMAAALVESRFRDVAFYITVIVSYIAGVATFRRAELEFREKALNGFLAPIVSAFLIWSDVLTWRDNTCRWIPALLLSFAWGIINSDPNIQHACRSPKQHRRNIPIPKEGILMSFSVILGFILGAGWSVFLNHVAPQMKAFGSFAAMGVIYGGLFLWLDRGGVGSLVVEEEWKAV
ncbi:hypothetical protein HJC23_009949 [Cyclotella cryptica]|uniref:DUF1275 domain protein n=1 Tax=Cyclotella cryptica TaxID=29204 RepID=A0ABD3Q9Q7_9STRA|eukprot:CCRYP_007699-RA/>CCRYP_007699-RA protein AED:0.21 eAED:0.21 QI:82/0/1/1/1/1/2/1646/313